MPPPRRRVTIKSMDTIRNLVVMNSNQTDGSGLGAGIRIKTESEHRVHSCTFPAPALRFYLKCCGGSGFITGYRIKWREGINPASQSFEEPTTNATQTT